MQARPNFGQFFDAKMNHYLNTVNPLPVTASQKIHNFFSLSGKTGRERALAYQNAKRHTMEKFLFEAVVADVRSDNGEGDLGTSKKLRIALMEALCDFLRITPQQRQHAQAQELQAMNGNGGETYIKIIALKRLIRDAVAHDPHQVIAAMNEAHINQVVRQIG